MGEVQPHSRWSSVCLFYNRTPGASDWEASLVVSCTGPAGTPRSVTLALSSPGSQLFMNTEVFVESMTSARLKGTSGPV